MLPKRCKGPGIGSVHDMCNDKKKKRVFVQHVITMSYLATDLGLQKTTNGIIISYEDNHAAILFWSL